MNSTVMSHIHGKLVVETYTNLGTNGEDNTIQVHFKDGDSNCDIHLFMSRANYKILIDELVQFSSAMACGYCGNQEADGNEGLCQGCEDELKNAHKDDDYPRRGRIQ